MPGIVKVRVVSARDLPIMDRSSELTDAFVELRLGESLQRTRVCPKTLNPVWNSQWFIFNVSDEDLQDEPLQIKLMDHDIYTAHDAIGKVYICLNSLTDSGREASNTMDGWFPIYDTLHGIRGQVHLVVKVEVIRDQHRFKQSSCGVMFFACPEVPCCYTVQSIHGFVEELVVNDDPEYQWIDKIRTPRASNEARQRLFSKLSGELQRKIGLKTLEVGGNAVIGYRQCFDLEGESGIVVRGIGTCVNLIHKLPSVGGCPTPIEPIQLPANMQHQQISGERDELLVMDPISGLVSPQHHGVTRTVSLSDSDGPPSPTKTVGGLTVGEVAASASTSSAGLHPATVTTAHGCPEITSSSEFPFYTLSLLPPGTLSNIGGLVSAHSVKLLDKINNPDEPETRDAWWHEVRNEVRLHTRAMNCNAVIGYSETTSICDNLCVFSAFGTAVCISSAQQQLPRRLPTSPGSGNESHEGDKDTESTNHDASTVKQPRCGACHIPYSVSKLPFEGKLSKCQMCRSRLVPAVLLSTCEVPPGIAVRGRGTLIQATAVRHKKKLKGDDNAQQVGQTLPFLESRLHGRLLNKLRLKGMNALFQFRMLLNIGDTIVVGTAVGTAVYLEALPGPSKLLLSSKDSNLDPGKLEEYQTALTQTQGHNKMLFELEHTGDHLSGLRADSADINGSFTDDSHLSAEGGGLGARLPDLSTGNKETLVFPMDDQLLSLENLSDVIADRALPTGFHVSNSHVVPGLPVGVAFGETKMVTSVTKIVTEAPRQMIGAPRQTHNTFIEKQFSKFFNRLLQRLAFKVRHMTPCALTNITYDIDLPEDNELQVAVTAMVTGLKIQEDGHVIKKSQSDELIFNMEETLPSEGSQNITTTHREPQATVEDRGDVVHTSSLPFIPGYHVNRYLGIINLFLIRESTSVGEVSGVNSFMHLFILEALSIARAHVAAHGGNALLSYRLSELVFIEHPQKNQAQCLLNLSGDAAVLSPNSSNLPGIGPSHSSNKDSPQHHALQEMQLIQMPELLSTAKQLLAHDTVQQPLRADPDTKEPQTRPSTDSMQTKYLVTKL